MSASDFFKKLQPLFESADTSKQEESETVLEGEAAMAKKYAEFLREEYDFDGDDIDLEPGSDGHSGAQEVEIFTNRDDWQRAVEQAGYEFSSWGNGSAHAHDVDGRVIGTWTANFDCNNGERPRGWLKRNSELDEEVVTELSPMTIKRASDKRLGNFETASERWEQHNSPSLIGSSDDNPFDQEVSDAFTKLQRNHRLVMGKKQK